MIVAYRLGYYLAISIPQFAPKRARWRHLILVSLDVIATAASTD
jgi:hypothetical protein